VVCNFGSEKKICSHPFISVATSVDFLGHCMSKRLDKAVFITCTKHLELALSLTLHGISAENKIWCCVLLLKVEHEGRLLRISACAVSTNARRISRASKNMATTSRCEKRTVCSYCCVWPVSWFNHTHEIQPTSSEVLDASPPLAHNRDTLA
jgi:hypothetical protein